MNNLNSDIIQVNQRLYIPNVLENSSSNIYVVQKGDNLYSIANRYGVRVDDIKQANNLNSNLIIVGQNLIIPM